eukprot:TRINITY_DN15470_c0_g2_i1.p1 TRINITY_DN15470_c0_g2~~TRINITY_DN15470_c0_g2_i1.p1  ORF type:complete len:579 (+),score=94.76 TRINITY_DN15470_c0_g2_i1:31-1737(+)
MSLSEQTMDYLGRQAAVAIRVKSMAIENALLGMKLRCGPAAKRLFANLSRMIDRCETAFVDQDAARCANHISSLEDCREVRMVISSLASLLVRAPPSALSAQGSCVFVLAVKNQGHTPEARALLASAVPLLGESSDAVPVSAFGSTMGALKQHYACPEIENVLTKFVTWIRRSGFAAGRLKPADTAAVLVGLSRMDESRMSRGLIAALCPYFSTAGSLDHKQLSLCLVGIGRHSKPETWKVLELIRLLVPQVSGVVDADSVAFALFGLRSQVCNPELRTLLTAFRPVIRGIQTEVKADAIGMMLAGVGGNANSPEWTATIQTIAPLMQVARGPITGVSFGMGLHGLRGAAPTRIVRNVLSSLLPLLQRSSSALDPTSFGTALYGMRAMGDTEEVRQVMSELSKQLNTTAGGLPTSHAIASALYGLSLHNDSRSVREVLAAVSRMLSEGTEAITGQGVGMSLFGLGSHRGCSNLIRTLLTQIAQHIRAAPPLTSLQLANALYGLNGFHVETDGVVAVLAALGMHTKNLRGTEVPPKDLGGIVYGLRGVADSEQANAIRAGTKGWSSSVT